MKPDAGALIRRAAERARARPEFLGWVLARYEELKMQPGESLREPLRVAEEDWPRLQLCLRPRPEAFLDDVTRIAAAFGADRSALAAVVRRVEAVEAVRRRDRPGQAGSLLAARARKPKGRPPEREASDE
jgi:hypothetical protein